MANDPNGVFSTSSFDALFLPALMSRLRLPSQSLDVLPLQSPLPVDPSSDHEDGEEDKHRRILAREESRLEREIIRIIHSGDANRLLKPNSGQSVAIGENNICVSSHEEPGSEYCVWEWHGHIMFFDDESGYNAEYIYGNYFERLPEEKDGKKEEASDEEEEVKLGGLRDLIGDPKGPVGSGGGRVIHRNSINPASSK